MLNEPHDVIEGDENDPRTIMANAHDGTLHDLKE